MSQAHYSAINASKGVENGPSSQIFVQNHASRAGIDEMIVIFLDFLQTSPDQNSDLAHLFADSYINSQGADTSALRRSFKLINDRLTALNRGNARPISGSLTCALVSPRQVIIAQSGPAIAFARSADGSFEMMDLPERQPLPWPAGREGDIVFHNISPRQGDVFVITGANSFQNVSSRIVEACMSKGGPRMAAGYLNANVGDGSMVGVAFALPEAAAQETAPPARVMASAPAQEPARDALSAVPEIAATGIGQKIIQAIRQSKEAIGLRASQAAKETGKGLSSFGGQLLPQTPSAPTTEQRSRATLFGLGFIALLLPIFVAAIVAIGYLQFSGEADRQRQLALIRAQADQARVTNDPAAWTKTIDLVNAYQQKFSSNEQVSAAGQQAREQLDKLYGVARIRPMALTQLAPANTRKLSATPLGLYTLDSSTGETLYYTLSADHASIMGKPVVIAAPGPAGQTQYKDIAWASSTANRWHSEGAILASGESVGEYSLSTGQMTVMRYASDPPAAPASIDLFGDQLYVLDTGAGQILRMRVEGGALTRLPPYFRSPYNPLKDSVDMAIDGAVYLLQRNGSALKYVAALPVQFALQNLPEPINSPVAIALLGPNRDNGSVFIADAKTNSIFQFDKNGVFIRQYRSSGDEFSGIMDLAADPASNMLYALTPKAIFGFRPQ